MIARLFSPKSTTSGQSLRRHGGLRWGRWTSRRRARGITTPATSSPTSGGASVGNREGSGSCPGTAASAAPWRAWRSTRDALSRWAARVVWGRQGGEQPLVLSNSFGRFFDPASRARAYGRLPSPNQLHTSKGHRAGCRHKDPGKSGVSRMGQNIRILVTGQPRCEAAVFPLFRLSGLRREWTFDPFQGPLV